jgi:ABC-type Na+ efflux pump permease subunit
MIRDSFADMLAALRGALFIARADLAILFRAKETWLWSFVMPIVFFWAIGTITAGFGGGSGARDRIGLVAPADAGYLAAHLAARLERAGLDVVQGPAAEKERNRLTLPAGFTAQMLAGKSIALDYRHVSEGMQTGYDMVRVQRAAYGTIADLVVLQAAGTPASSAALAAHLAEPQLLTVVSRAATRRLDPPAGYDQSVPGMMVMFALIVMLTSGGVQLLQERKEGILRRLAGSPLPRAAIVLGKWGSRFTLGLLQMAFGAATATLWLHVHWGDHPFAVAGVLALFAAFAATLGLLLGNFAQSEGQTIAIGVAFSNVAAALGGCMWPMEVTPAWTQTAAFFFPTGWVMDALHKLMHFGLDPSTVLPHVIVLLALTLITSAALAKWFRFQ